MTPTGADAPQAWWLSAHSGHISRCVRRQQLHSVRSSGDRLLARHAADVRMSMRSGQRAPDDAVDVLQPRLIGGPV